MTELSDGDTSETKSGGLSSGGFSSGLVVACDPHPAVVSLLIWKLDFYGAYTQQLLASIFILNSPAQMMDANNEIVLLIKYITVIISLLLFCYFYAMQLLFSALYHVLYSCHFVIFFFLFMVYCVSITVAKKSRHFRT
ncbi:uncharacterized protein LOC132059725 isoform X1 [Lycium ferocissimum]|uniref:uncharacterized protein LOC132059725 isoform X1 n=1 Tax=Lycium ferocissimum TaxID=112874 RepID=UPI0028152E60|nr:uncharacterized protein LOC132059725 isoform X1 [Lycium ferocissimum]